MKKYKKIISAVMALVITALPVLTGSPVCSYAEYGEYVTDDGFHYMTDGSEAVMINLYDGTDSDVVIPKEINGVPVKYLNRSFINSSVTSVVLPSTMFDSGFNYHEMSLKNVTFLADEIKFSGNISETGIEELVFPNVANIYAGAFMDCKNLKKVVYGGTVSKIESETYSGCNSLTELEFLDSSSSVAIEANAFADTGFVTLEFSPEVILRDSSFNNCKNLETVNFKNNVSMSGIPFSNCNAIKSIEFNGDVNMKDFAFSDCSSLENLSFDTSKKVDGRFFTYCSNVKYINNELAFDETTGDFNPKYKDFIVKNFSDADDVGFINDYVMWHVKDIVNKYISDDMSDMEKIKVLHDWVCDNVSYTDGEISDSINHNDFSPFLTGITVCDGYARAFNLLMNEAGIETYYVCSNDHIWNIVKLGGHFFHVDTTWDDGESDYNYFLKSDNEIMAETSSHSYWNLKMPSSLHSFQKDTMPECAYSMGDCNTDGSISVADIVKMNTYLLGTKPISADDIVLYDLDFNGKVDVFDMIEMRKLITVKSAETPYSDDIIGLNDYLLGKSDYSNPDWDLNGDGRIDAFDMIMLRQELSE